MSKYTKNQHIIPVMILKRHRITKIPLASNNDTYRYDRKFDCEYKTNIKDIYEKNLYEFRNEYKKIDELSRNYIEKNLRKIESECSTIFDKFEQKCKVSEKERIFICLFTAIQILRTPEVLDFCKNYFKMFDENLKEYVADKYAKLSCLNFSPKLQENQMLTDILTIIMDKSIKILHSTSNPYLINEYRPVLVISHKPGLENLNIFFPFSARNCLMFSPAENIIKRKNNSIVYEEIPRDFVNYINYHNYLNKGRFVCCSEHIANLFADFERIKEEFQKSVIGETDNGI